MHSDAKIALLLLLWRRKKSHLLLEAFMSMRVERQLIPSWRLDLTSMSNADCKLAFRFDVEGIKELTVRLRLPEVIVTSTGDKGFAVEALAIVLYRLTYPSRYTSQVSVFGRSVASICRIFLTTVDLMYSVWRKRLYFPISLLRSRVQVEKPATFFVRL